MSRISQPTSPVVGNTPPNSSGQAGEGVNDLDINSFLSLLIAEMQNQDPMNPMDNAAMIEQIGQIRSIGATSQLTESLNSLTTNQQLVTASSLIGQEISGISDTGEIKGVVDRISVNVDKNDPNSRTVKVHVGDRTIDIENIRQIATQT